MKKSIEISLVELTIRIYEAMTNKETVLNVFLDIEGAIHRRMVVDDVIYYRIYVRE